MDQCPEEITLGDKRVEIITLDRYKGRKGQKDRIAVVGRTLLRGNTHYFNNSSFRCLTTDPKDLAVCCVKLGPATQRFAVVVFHYAADADGEILAPEKCSGTLKVWLLSETRYDELNTLQKQWPLMDGGCGKPQHDLIIKCTEEQYQKMTIMPAPVAHWKTKEEWYNVISGKAEQAKFKMRLALGKKLSLEEVKELLMGPAASANPVPTQTSADINLSDVLEKANI